VLLSTGSWRGFRFALKSFLGGVSGLLLPLAGEDFMLVSWDWETVSFDDTFPGEILLT
jgi:hypothetical protein